jgi:hypothetical protein
MEGLDCFLSLFFVVGWRYVACFVDVRKHVKCSFIVFFFWWAVLNGHLFDKADLLDDREEGCKPGNPSLLIMNRMNRTGLLKAMNESAKRGYRGVRVSWCNTSGDRVPSSALTHTYDCERNHQQA